MARTETLTALDTTVAATTPDSAVDTVAPTSVAEEFAQDIEADTAAAEVAVLTVADLPEGWTEAPEADEADALAARLAECVDVDGDQISAADATAAAGRFVAPEGTASISQHVGVLATEQEARTVVVFSAEPDVPSCFETAYSELAGAVLAATLVDGAQVGTPVAERLQVGSAGDATQAIRVVVPVTGDPTIAEVTVDHVIVRSGRSLATFTFVNAAEATTVEAIDEVTALIAERLPV